MGGKHNLVYSEEFYQIMGLVFKVHNALGFGHKEHIYQKALANEFHDNNIKFVEQLRYKLKYKEKELGIYILDFLIFDKIILEIKQRSFISAKDIDQLYRYLKVTGLQLGIIITFTRDEVKYKRVVNLK